jgi:DnaK suppressor protein
MALTASELKSYEERLRTRMAELEQGARLLDEIVVETSAEEVENVQLAGERDMAISKLDREATLLNDVREALERISDGSYGICMNCEREISRGRLNAVPWAAYCIRCQEAIDEMRRGSSGGDSSSLGREAA